MLCEGRLLSMTYADLDLDPLRPPPILHRAYGGTRAAATFIPSSSRHALLSHQDSPEQMAHSDIRRASDDLHISPLQSLERQISPQIEIPAQAYSGSDPLFLVPSFCQSFCQNYSDLHIGGDQVLPRSAYDGDPRGVPALQSCEVHPAVEDSPPGQIPQTGLLHPLRGGSSRWRQGSTRDRSFLLQGREGPFSNSLLNNYLDQKILDLYQLYMMENMAREKPGTGSDVGPVCPWLGSELVLTSLDQITLQLSRERNLEAGFAKDLVRSCWLRVAGEMQSSEISTPFLQFSNETSEEKEEESP